MQLRSPSFFRAAAGFTLLEVLVALVVLSVGLLGLSGLQTTSLRNNHSAFLRSQATIVTHDIIDRMRANRDSARNGNYDIAYASSPTSTSCTGTCSALQVAQMDVEEWRDYVERLPGGESELDVDGTSNVATIKVRWADARDSGNKLQVVTRVQL
ncbi:MAG: type IV pilus modification protein PilV [Chromatiaceae bacterium]|nr:type IV pilus modification protein PilV [Chromatiaceae bacterium]